MQDVKIEDIGDYTYLISPYNAECVRRAHELNGRWDRARRAWAFDKRDHDRVVRIASDVYGYSEGDVQTVDVRIKAGDHSESGREIAFAGREVAYRPGRDEDVRLGDNVVIVSGHFAPSAGSRNNPYVFDISGDNDHGYDVVLEVRDVPVSLLKKESHYTIVKGNPVAALKSKRAELLKQVAEIDKQIAAMTEKQNA